MFTGRKSQIVLENLNIRLIINLIKQGHQSLKAGWIQLLGNCGKERQALLNHAVYRLLLEMVFQNVCIFSAFIYLFINFLSLVIKDQKEYCQNWSLHVLLICPAWTEALIFFCMPGSAIGLRKSTAQGLRPGVPDSIAICQTGGISMGRDVKSPATCEVIQLPPWRSY